VYKGARMIKRCLILAVGLLVPAAPAAASNVVYVCGKDLCARQPGAAHAERLTRDGRKTGGYSSPSLSRAGRRIAFRLDNPGRVFTAKVRRRRGRITGIGRRTRIEPFRDGPRDATQFDVAISPNGRRVAWTEFRFNVVFDSIDYRRYAANLDGSGAEQVASSGGRPFVAWFRSGSILREGLTPAIDAQQTGESVDQGICAPDPASETNGTCSGPGARQLAFDPSGRHLRHPTVAPNGRLLAATAYAFGDGIDNAVERPGAIALFDTATAAPIRDLTRGPNDLYPSFAPNGKMVAFQRRGSVMTVRVSGGRPRRLARRATQPTWSR
jgi:Tol biopolymer transport system component